MLKNFARPGRRREIRDVHSISHVPSLLGHMRWNEGARGVPVLAIPNKSNTHTSFGLEFVFLCAVSACQLTRYPASRTGALYLPLLSPSLVLIELCRMASRALQSIARSSPLRPHHLQHKLGRALQLRVKAARVANHLGMG